MTKNTFIFLVFVLIGVPLEQLHIPWVTSFLNVLCIMGLLTVGLSHGAIDHLLYSKKEKSKTAILSKYIVLILFNTLLWFLFPYIAFSLFLIISSYHFGQSQWIDYQNINSNLSKILYLFWGALVLIGLFNFNQPELLHLIEQHGSISLLNKDYFKFIPVLFLGIILVFTVLIGFLLFQKKISFSEIIFEIYILSLLFISFKFSSLLLGFSLYFIILHAGKVLKEEFVYLKKENQVESTFDFIKALTPFTFIAIAGISTVVLSLIFFKYDISILYILLISVSSITIPHALIMDIFYKR